MPAHTELASLFTPSQLSRASLILRESEPLNLEGPFDTLDARLTPSDLFYVRSHFPVPEIEAAAFRLTVSGEAGKQLQLSLDDLMSLPSTTRTATLECAGNGRIYLSPQADGVQWQTGAVGTAEWTGVPLRAILDLAQLYPSSRELVLEGADRGSPKEKPKPPGPITYSRSLAIEKSDDVVLAWAMNGKPLSREHGFPLRAIVPGSYAMASVKWLTRIHILAQTFQGYFQTSDYAIWDEMAGFPTRKPITSLALKSSIARPAAGQEISLDSTVAIFGAAWSGGPEVDHVDLSTDGGSRWTRTQMIDPHEPGVWRRWQYLWTPRQAGQCLLMSRAVDVDGNIQPSERDPRLGSYVVHHIIPVAVTIR